jgi:hypothetical protein
VLLVAGVEARQRLRGVDSTRPDTAVTLEQSPPHRAAAGDYSPEEAVMRRLLLVLCCLAAVSPAHALRCGTGVVNPGDSTLKLLHLCGQPTLKEQQSRRVLQRTYDRIRGAYYDDYISVPYEVWTYNFGPRRFIQLITIEDGKIKDIESGGYGY